MGRLQRFFAWPGLVPAIAQVAFGTATGLFASRALLHIQNILENQRPETTVEESDEDDAVEGYDETDFDAIMRRYEQYITKASGICLTMAADHDEFLGQFLEFKQKGIDNISSKSYQYTAFKNVVNSIFQKRLESKLDSNEKTLLCLLRSNQTLAKIFKYKKVKNFNTAYEKYIMESTVASFIDKTVYFQMTFLTTLMPMLDSLCRFGKGHVNVKMHRINFTNVNFTGISGMYVGLSTENTLKSLGMFTLTDVIKRCIRGDAVFRHIFIMSAPGHVFVVVYEQSNGEELLYALDNLNDDDYLGYWGVNGMHKTLLSRFSEAFPSASVGISDGDELVHYTFELTENVEYPSEGFEEYNLDCSYMTYRHCILMHILPPIRGILQRVIIPSGGMTNELMLIDSKLHDQYRNIFAQMWRSFMALSAREGNLLICPNTYNSTITYDSFFEIDVERGRVVRWRYEDFRFVEVQTEGRIGEPLDTCTVSAHPSVFL